MHFAIQNSIEPQSSDHPRAFYFDTDKEMKTTLYRFNMITMFSRCHSVIYCICEI